MSDGPALRHNCGFTDGPVVTFWEQLRGQETAGRPTIVMIHGGSHTGTCWMVTADGRPGWATDFAERGFPVVVADWPGVGRSGAVSPDLITGQMVCAGLGDVVAGIVGPVVLLTHSMGGGWGWVVADQHRDKLVAILAIAPGPPGNMQPEPQVLSRLEYEIVVQVPHRRVTLPLSGLVTNDDAFVDQKLIGTGTRFPAAFRNRYAASLVGTASRLVRQRMNVDGSQVRVAEPARFRDLPVLVVTGSDDLEHPREADAAIVDWLRGHGAEAEFAWLPDHGIAGNGHMMMLETNSREIAGVLCDWLAARCD